MSVFDNFVSDDFNEITIDKKAYKEKFFELLAADGFDFADIDDATRLPKSLIPVISNDTEPFNKFNICLSKLHKYKIVNLMDAVTFLVSDYLEAPTALKCLDEMNFIIVKNEFEKKYKIHSNDEEQELSLLDFLK